MQSWRCFGDGGERWRFPRGAEASPPASVGSPPSTCSFCLHEGRGGGTTEHPFLMGAPGPGRTGGDAGVNPHCGDPPAPQSWKGAQGGLAALGFSCLEALKLSQSTRERSTAAAWCITSPRSSTAPSSSSSSTRHQGGGREGRTTSPLHRLLPQLLTCPWVWVHDAAPRRVCFAPGTCPACAAMPAAAAMPAGDAHPQVMPRGTARRNAALPQRQGEPLVNPNYARRTDPTSATPLWDA